jgi:nitrogenase molybdenum-cofactor synthesis protein NifE
MLSGGRSQFVALKAKMPWLDINQERHHAYAGYEGMVVLLVRHFARRFRCRRLR